MEAILAIRDVALAILFAGTLTLIYHLLKAARTKRKERIKQQSIAKLKKKLWILVSYYVRKSASDWRGYASCYTCGKTDEWRAFDAGHFIPKSTGGAALYFNLDNIRPQCTGCNRFRHGNLTVYAMKLEEERKGTLKKLHALRGQPYSKKDLEKQIEIYKQKIKLLDEHHESQVNPAGTDRQLLSSVLQRKHQAQKTA